MAESDTRIVCVALRHTLRESCECSLRIRDQLAAVGAEIILVEIPVVCVDSGM
jgi:hypothetical protein